MKRGHGVEKDVLCKVEKEDKSIKCVQTKQTFPDPSLFSCLVSGLSFFLFFRFSETRGQNDKVRVGRGRERNDDFLLFPVSLVENVDIVSIHVLYTDSLPWLEKWLANLYLT